MYINTRVWKCTKALCSESNVFFTFLKAVVKQTFFILMCITLFFSFLFLFLCCMLKPRFKRNWLKSKTQWPNWVNPDYFKYLIAQLYHANPCHSYKLLPLHKLVLFHHILHFMLAMLSPA